MKIEIIQKCTFLSVLATALAKNYSKNAIEFHGSGHETTLDTPIWFSAKYRDYKEGADAIELLGSGHEATLDTPIWFSAKYRDYKEGEKIMYLWEDDLWTVKTITNSSGLSNWNITYDSKTYSDYTGSRSVTVTVFGANITDLVTASFDFTLRGTLVGNILINQVNVTIPTPAFISTGNQTNLTALMHDPEEWMKSRTKKVHFYWYISTAPHVLPDVKIRAECSTPSLLINLTQPGSYIIDVVVTLSLYNISSNAPSQSIYKDNIVSNVSSAATPGISSSPAVTVLPTQFVQSSLHTTHFTHHTHPTHPPPNVHNWTCDGWWPPSSHTNEYFSKMGYLRNGTIARDPIDSMTIKGNTWIDNGDLLKLNISCSGSGPWYSCNKTLDDNYNITGTETCKSENMSAAETNFNECSFNFSRYFKYDGSYAYLFIIYNDVSIMRRNITINIYKGEPRPYLYSIILPVFCSLVVTIIIILGWIALKREKERYFLEVADFDFVCHDEVEFNGILDQLKKALTSALLNYKEEEEDSESRRRKRSNIVVEKLDVLDFASGSDAVNEH